MKITTQKEFDNNVKNGVFDCNDNLLKITCNIVTTGNINAGDINACNIDAYNINAHNIDYNAFCISYNNIKCNSISGRRENSFHKCLDRIDDKTEKSYNKNRR